MKNIYKLLHIIYIIQESKTMVTAQELSEKLDTNIRTIYRYIDVLRDANFPIDACTGRGYNLKKGYYLPPIMFTEKEAAALLMGSKFVINKADHSYKRDVNSAFDKIKNNLKKETLDYINKIGNSMIVINDKFVDKNLLAKIQNSIAKTTTIKLDYYSLKGENTKREIEPMGMIYYNDSWRIIAYCRLRKDFREFRTNRINKILYTNHKFEKRNFSLENFVSKFYEIHHPIELKVWFDKKSAQIVKEKYSMGLTSEKNKQNGMEMTFLIDSSRANATANWMLSFHKCAKVISPKEFKNLLIEKATDILKLY